MKTVCRILGILFILTAFVGNIRGESSLWNNFTVSPESEVKSDFINNKLTDSFAWKPSSPTASVDLSEKMPTESEASWEKTVDSFSFSKDVIIRGASRKGVRSFQIWGDYYIGSGKIDPKDRDFTIDNDLNGAQIGLNLGLGSAFLVTGYYNYNKGKVDYQNKNNEVNNHLGAVGLRYNMSGFYFSLIGDYGDDSYTLEEDGGGRSLNYDGWQSGGSFETGYEMSTGGLFTLRPFGNFQYSHIACDGFDRNAMRLIDDDIKYDVFYQTLGARIDVDLSLITFQGRMAWVHQYLDSAPVNKFWYSRIPGTYTPTQLFYEGNAGRDYFWGGAGLKCSLGPLAATLDYDVLINKYEAVHFGSVGLLWGF